MASRAPHRARADCPGLLLLRSRLSAALPAFPIRMAVPGAFGRRAAAPTSTPATNGDGERGYPRNDSTPRPASVPKAGMSGRPPGCSPPVRYGSVPESRTTGAARPGVAPRS